MERSTHAPSTPQPPAAARGTKPNSATVAPMTTHTAGAGTTAASSSLGRWLASWLLIASARPAPSPLAARTSSEPPIATVT